MITDGLLTILIGILNIVCTPLAPAFAWVPTADSTIGGVPALLTSALSNASVVLYYLNLGPAMKFALTLIGGAISVRVTLIALDLILPPIPFVGALYRQVTNFIRGVM